MVNNHQISLFRNSIFDEFIRQNLDILIHEKSHYFFRVGRIHQKIKMRFWTQLEIFKWFELWYKLDSYNHLHRTAFLDDATSEVQL